LSKSHFIGPENPTDQDTAEGIESHEGGIDGPFVLHPAGIKNDQARNTLESDKRRGCKLPGIVTGVEPVWRFQEGHIVEAICLGRHGCGCATCAGRTGIEKGSSQQNGALHKRPQNGLGNKHIRVASTPTERKSLKLPRPFACPCQSFASMIHLTDPTSGDKTRRELGPPRGRDMRRRSNESHYTIGGCKSTQMGNTDDRQMNSCILIAVGKCISLHQLNRAAWEARRV
jgi:hypothetical protein